MEVLNGVVSKSIIPCKLNNTHVGKSSVFVDSKVKLLSFSNVRINDDSRNLVVKVVNCGYENKGHLEYYGEVKGKGKKGWNGVSTKKKMKLLKGLSKDLSTFSDLGFGLSFDCDGINQGLVADHIDKSMIISQAAEVLRTQLKQLKSEEEKQKKREKEEKKKCKNNTCDSSSSSSSESSDSECDEVVDLKRLRNISVVQPIESMNETQSNNDIPLPTTLALSTLKGSKNDHIPLNSDQSCCNMILETTLNKDTTIDVLSSNTLNVNQPNVGKKIEVCMGGKCKKSGAPALIEEFQKAVRDEGVVVGCKCMGKCKTGPNVKLSNGVVAEGLSDDSLRTPSNPLYIGVGLEDVELIVSSYFGSGLSVAGVAT